MDCCAPAVTKIIYYGRCAVVRHLTCPTSFLSDIFTIFRTNETLTSPKIFAGSACHTAHLSEDHLSDKVLKDPNCPTS